MISLQCEDLIVSLFRKPLARVSSNIELLGVLAHILNVFDEVLVDSELVSLLLAHDINVKAELLVLSLNIIVPMESLIELVLEELDFVLVLLHLGGGRPHLLEVFSLLS
jgi:hypothetical protein